MKVFTKRNSEQQEQQHTLERKKSKKNYKHMQAAGLQRYIRAQQPDDVGASFWFYGFVVADLGELNGFYKS